MNDIIDKVFLDYRASIIMEDYEKVSSHEVYSSNDFFYVIFLPWNMSFEDAYKSKMVPEVGRGIIYDGPRSLVGLEPKQSIKALKNLKKDFLSKLKKLNKDNKPIIIIGYSIGTLPASYFTSFIKCKKLFLIAPGAKLGENIWAALLTQKIKKISIDKGFKTPEEYDKVMKGYNPIDNVKYFPKDTHIIYGTTDKISPPKNAEKIIKSEFNFKKLHLCGHVSTIIYGSRYIRKHLNFV